MKFSLLFGSAILAATALAAPLTSERQARNEARHLARADAALRRGSNPPFKPGTTELLDLDARIHRQYSSNWAGAVLIGTGYSSVTAEFTVPRPQYPTGSASNTQYCASAWVGIDGDTCTTAILQAGIDFCILGSSVTYSAWYEWYPDYAHNFDGINISAGDVIRVTVDATSLTAGTATVENISTRQSVTHTFTGGVDGSLCEYNAEWIVEDFQMNGSLVPLANFGTVTFTGAEARTGNSIVGPGDATLIDIYQKSHVYTASSVNGNSVTVQYV